MPFPIKPFVGAPSSKEFYVPPEVQTDFERYLDTDIPNVNFTFEVVSDWTKRADPDYEKRFLRAEMYPINWKSNFANADYTMNFKTDLRVVVQKGDLVIREDGQIRLLNWKVERHINDQSTQAQECNLLLDIKRQMPEEVSPTTGMLVKEAYEKAVATQQPCSIFQYDGRPSYDMNTNAAGIAPDAITMLQVQWNPETRAIRIGDEFDWFVDRYRIINIDYGGIDVSQTSGVLKMHAKKVAGGSVGKE